MDEVMTRAVERLAEQFADLPLTTVVRVVTDCVANNPQAEPSRIEQIARAALAALSDQPEQRGS